MRPACFDIDFFKKLNDNYGHQFGDKVLVEIAKVTKETLRTVDLIGRYNGEEFLVILPATPLGGGVISSGRIAEAIRNIKWEHDDLTVTISGGLVSWQDEDAKENGRNRIEHLG